MPPELPLKISGYRICKSTLEPREMLNAGHHGFRHAPITKLLLLLTMGASIGLSLTNTKHLFSFSPAILHPIPRFSQFWRIFTHQLFFHSAGDMLFGLLLLYSFRVFERQMGSERLGVFLTFCFVLSALIELFFLLLFPLYAKTLVSGPYALIFAFFVLFYSTIPPVGKFRLWRLPLTDKIFIYLLCFQLSLASLPMSLVAAFAGVASACLYRSELLPFRRLHFPRAFSNFCSRTFSPLLQAPIQPGVQHRGANPDPQTMMHMQAAQAAAAQQLAQQLAQQMAPHVHAPNPNPNPNPNVAAAPANTPAPLVEALKAMGFSQEEAVHALRATNNDIHAAVNLLTS